MEKYLINKILLEKPFILITLLDYEIQISMVLNKIKIPEANCQNIIIDTILVSGNNEYRFVKTSVDEEGKINLKNYQYIKMEENFKKNANKILIRNSYLENSILSERQKEKIKNEFN